ncbi:glycosyltransferase domain-containing protein [Streptococcus suis]
MNYKEEIASLAAVSLSQQIIDLKQSKQYRIGSKLKIFLELIKHRKIAQLFGLIYLSLSRKNATIHSTSSFFERPFVQNYTGRVAVYTCIIGIREMIKNPVFISPNCDYYIITNKEVPLNSIWKKIDVNDLDIPCKEPNEINRYVKLHPHLLFPDYEYSLYIDGNIQIVSDVIPMINQMSPDALIGLHLHDRRRCVFEEASTFSYLPRLKKFETLAKIQMDCYKKEGLPKNYGLFENPILIRKHNVSECIEIMNLWWEQMMLYTMRDQLSLPYVFWKLDICNDYVHILGENLRLNPRFIQFEHD